MSSDNQPEIGRAEKAFRDAFDRLKRDKPKIRPRGKKITQNNVAREAGLDPSALRRSRFPKLIQEIQDWIQQNQSGPETGAASALDGRAKKREAREQLRAMKVQRDDALARLVDAEARILELTMDNDRLKALQNTPKVSKLRSV